MGREREGTSLGDKSSRCFVCSDTPLMHTRENGYLFQCLFVCCSTCVNTVPDNSGFHDITSRE